MKIICINDIVLFKKIVKEYFGISLFISKGDFCFSIEYNNRLIGICLDYNKLEILKSEKCDLVICMDCLKCDVLARNSIEFEKEFYDVIPV